jgi:glutamyl-tRNA(Gln) amidotransferase subunit D
LSPKGIVLSEEDLSGYVGLARELLLKAGAHIGDRISVQIQRPKGQKVTEGLLMPRVHTGREDNYIVLKLKTGYNVGVRIESTSVVEVKGKGVEPHFARPPEPPQTPGLPKVSIISTGGTIASRVDYRTDAVQPALGAEDLYSVVPELAQVADVQAKVLFSIFSENIGPQHWSKIASTVEEEIGKGADGVVITHGTDTLGYTAAALSFALSGTPVPVVLVGSQRSSDRPSSDAATNLLASAAVAGKAPFAEVVVAMHDWVSDEKIAVHRGTKVRKCHTSRRDAFRSVNAEPIAYYDVVNRSLELKTKEYAERQERTDWRGRNQFDPNVTLIKYHSGLSVGVLDWAIASGYKGIVLEGTGLGHVGEVLFPALERAAKEGIVVAMCSQCIWGGVNMNVYSTGRDLLKLGVLPLGDMLAETALAKMMWALGQESEPEKVKEIMLTNLAHEYSEKRILEAPE